MKTGRLEMRRNMKRRERKDMAGVVKTEDTGVQRNMKGRERKREKNTLDQ